MKRVFLHFLTGLLLSAAPMFSNAQNPGVADPRIDPNPGKVGQTATLSFKYTNSNAAIINGLGAGVTVQLNDMEFVLSGNAPQLSGPGAEYFDWTINPQGLLVGTQNRAIPAPLNSDINIVVRYTVASPANEGGTINGNGAVINIQPGGANNANTTDDNVSYYTYTDGVLPVSFGAIDASYRNNNFIVSWETLKEQNNKEFRVEVSGDGKVFRTLGVVPAAGDGNSDVTQKYSFSKTLEELSAQLGGFPVAVAVVLLSVVAMLVIGNKRKALLIPVLLFGLTLGAFSCKKNDKISIPEPTDVFVRIGQVDQDGTVNYSTVIKVSAQ